MLTVNTNIGSLIAANQLNKLNNEYNDLKEQSTTGKRINSAADDSSGLAMLIGMESQYRGNSVAIDNISRGKDLLSTQEGAMNSINGMFDRLTELATKASDGTLSDTDRAKANTEAQDIMSEIDRTASKTEYNGIKLLDGSTASIDLQVGGSTDVADKISVDMYDGTLANMAINIGDLTSVANANTFLDNLETDLEDLANGFGKIGAYVNRLDYASENLTNANENLKSSMSNIEDADMAKVASELSKNETLQQLGYSMLQRSNAAPQSYLSLFA